jgi:hypothetical protein
MRFPLPAPTRAKPLKERVCSSILSTNIDQDRIMQHFINTIIMLADLPMK